MFANGDDAKNFITSEREFKAAFNRVGLCAFKTGATVVAFSIEDSHPHVLLWGEFAKCLAFKRLYESTSIRCIARRRGNADGVVLHCELYEVSDESYLMNVATYTIVQATKDGKSVMPYDYRYGTGALYFRKSYSILPWLVDDSGVIHEPVTFGSLKDKQKAEHCWSKTYIPNNWLVCNGFILPTNYVDIARFESIYKTHNCFRAFLSSGKNSDTRIKETMSGIRGLQIEDLEARRICESVCRGLFGKRTARHLTTEERLRLAQALRNQYHLAHRQLSFLTYIPETELRKYIR